MEKGVQRWAVDISNWKPSSLHFSAAISVLPQHDHSSITRFVKLEDRIRALVSRLLQYALVHQVLDIPFDDIIIRRTPEGKPFLVCDNMKLRFKNFNYNVSHHGDYVAIASEPICLVGLDIVSHSIPVNESAGKFIRNFSSHFSSLEWHHILNAGSSDEMLKVFYRYWCLKEAFVKAIGTGVEYKLDDVEFHHNNWDDIYVKVAGKELKDWKFWLIELGQNHSVSIARGHPKTAITNYTKTLKMILFDDKEYNLGLHLPNVSFKFVTVEDLVRLWHCADSLSIIPRKPLIAEDLHR
ncbi:l-aminoadipate-semialdehyde dehydrogenase-phosphopantetheinyl transferase [Phtheirospermum japonicum]|uniref:holo-[acyl-carrier-protein] synthase n=1 Tax=Phtheirospermum japonicum TaxID=374723 RepID=A0A830BV49_9LAMI|nr:l-aminoadipate-semialdehyde dehydrogenase-phosphopantetheinyl transferase [Phtheirospermum japonicum]